MMSSRYINNFAPVPAPGPGPVFNFPLPTKMAFCGYPDSSMIEHAIQRHWYDVDEQYNYDSNGVTQAFQTLATGQSRYVSFELSSTYHLITAYLLENTRLIQIFERLLDKYFNDEESLELYQTCKYLMEEFVRDHPTLISEPDFHDILDENIKELMHSHFDFDIFYNDDAEDEMEEIIDHAKTDFFKHYIPPRSYAPPDSWSLWKSK